MKYPYELGLYKFVENFVLKIICTMNKGEL